MLYMLVEEVENLNVDECGCFHFEYFIRLLEMCVDCVNINSTQHSMYYLSFFHTNCNWLSKSISTVILL